MVSAHRGFSINGIYYKPNAHQCAIPARVDFIFPRVLIPCLYNITNEYEYKCIDSTSKNNQAYIVACFKAPVINE